MVRHLCILQSCFLLVYLQVLSCLSTQDDDQNFSAYFDGFSHVALENGLFGFSTRTFSFAFKTCQSNGTVLQQVLEDCSY